MPIPREEDGLYEVVEVGAAVEVEVCGGGAEESDIETGLPIFWKSV